MGQAMKERRIPAAPALRCYACGSPYIAAFCHHCGRGMCADHTGEAIPATAGLLNALAVALGRRSEEESQLEAYGIEVRRIRLWDEFLNVCKVTEIRNPEYDLEVEDPHEVSASITAKFRRFWHRMVSRLRRVLFALPPPYRKPAGQTNHCRSCAHYVTYFRVWFIFLLVALPLLASLFSFSILTLGLFKFFELPKMFYALRNDFTLYLIAFPVSITSAGLFLLLWIMIYLHNLSSMLDIPKKHFANIPIPGQIREILVQEQRFGRIILDDNGNYQAIVQYGYGTLKVPLSFGYMDLYHYYDRFTRKAAFELGIANVVDRDLQVGFLGLSSHCLEMMTGDKAIIKSDLAFPLRISSGETPLGALTQNLKQPNVKSEKFTWRYHILDPVDKAKKELPIQVILRLPPDTQRREIELEFELTNPEMAGAVQAQIEKLDLYIPTDLGQIKSVRPEGRPDRSSSTSQLWPGVYFNRIAWKKLDFEHNRDEKGNPFRSRVGIRFSNEIILNTRLLGNLILLVPVAESGLNRVQVSYPCGTLRRQTKVIAETRYRIRLDLNLASLRYRTLVSFEGSISADGVTPDTSIVTKIADCLSKDGFYIKRVTENPSRLSNEDAKKFNRYWDISGRKYEGIYPVDFHLVLVGEEFNPRRNGHTGNTRADLTVQARVTDEKSVKDDRMEVKVAKAFDRLTEHIRSVIHP